VSLPKPVTLDVGALAFSLKHVQEDNSITVDRKMTVKTVAIGSEHYNILKKFYGSRVSADHDTVVLKKKAGS